jgi:hypothetical protein
MLKINEAIRVSTKTYILSKLMFVLIKEILQLLIIKYKKIDDQIKKQIHEKFQTLKQSSFKNQIKTWVANWENLRNRILTFDIKNFFDFETMFVEKFLIVDRKWVSTFCDNWILQKRAIEKNVHFENTIASIKTSSKKDWKSSNMSMSQLFRINYSLNRKSRRHRSVQISMRITIKHDNAYTNACMIKINVITFVSWSNHRIKNAIRKKKNE